MSASSPDRSTPRHERKVVIAGGGTAGHVLPALAVAEALVDKGYARGQILFIGSARGQEAELVPRRGFTIKLLPGRGLLRRLAPQAIATNAKSILGLGMAFAQSLVMLRQSRPSVVLAVGGYASLPPSLAAAILGVPLVVLNVDSVPGASNRFVARFAAVSAVAWPGTDLPRAVLTGAPLRQEITAIDPGRQAQRAAKETLGVPQDKALIVVTGGSLGAARLNLATLELTRLWNTLEDRVLWHVVGRRDWEQHKKRDWDQRQKDDGLTTGRLDYRSVEYEEDMPTVLTAADLIVSRAGAGAVAELTVAGRASVLVPLPNAPADHQSANAAILQRAGAAVVLADANCTAAKLAEILDELLGDKNLLAAMGKAAAALGRRDAADRVANLVDEVVSGSRRRTFKGKSLLNGESKESKDG